MAKPSKEIAAAVTAGYAAETGATAPYLWSSPCWEAWQFGRFMRETGRSIDGLNKGRGILWRTLGGYAFKGEYFGPMLQFERIA